MVLKSIDENKSWILTTWNTAFVMRWTNILFATNGIVGTFTDPVVKVGNKGAGSINVNPKDFIEEKELLAIQGYSNVFKGKLSINFNNGTDEVVAIINKSVGFPVDYEFLAKSMGPLMDTIELKMYAGK